MSRLLVIAAICGGLGVVSAPLRAADKVQLETHRQEGPLDVKEKRAQAVGKVPAVSFAAQARLKADGTIQYDCVEDHGNGSRQAKPHFHEEQ